MPTYVQYGCGHCAPSGWRNFDASPTLRLERLPLLGRLVAKNAARFPPSVEYGDITKGLPVPDGSAAGVYCSHVLEHLSLADLRIALANTKRMLARAGTFRLVVPDLELEATLYLASQASQPAVEFLRACRLGLEERERGARSFLSSWIGHGRHLWMWDFRSLSVELGLAGFTEIRRAQFGDGDDPEFQAIEDPARWSNCLGIQCRG